MANRTPERKESGSLWGSVKAILGVASLTILTFGIAYYAKTGEVPVARENWSEFLSLNWFL